MSLCSIRVFDTAQIAANAAGDAFIEGLSELDQDWWTCRSHNETGLRLSRLG